MEKKPFDDAICFWGIYYQNDGISIALLEDEGARVEVCKISTIKGSSLEISIDSELHLRQAILKVVGGFFHCHFQWSLFPPNKFEVR